MDFQRERLREAIRRRNQKLSAVSKALGKNHAYINQFFEKGTPKELSEKDRIAAEKFLGLSDGWLRDPRSPHSGTPSKGGAAYDSDPDMSHSGGEERKGEGDMEALTIALQRLLNRHTYETIANKLEELEVARSRPPERRRA